MPTPGLIKYYRYAAWDMKVLLYNFDINSAVLKVEHRNWITTMLTPGKLDKGLTGNPTRTRDMTALIIGFASRSGPDGLNLRLAKRRAEMVSDTIWRIDPGSLLTEVKFGLGELAAQIAGLKDGTEDERYRSVFVSVGDPDKQKVYGPVPAPPTKVERRVYARYMVDDQPGKMIPMDNIDRRAEAIMRASRKAMQYLVDITPEAERKEMIDDNLMPTEITLKVIKGGGDLYKFTRLEVLYTWGTPRLDGTCLVTETGVKTKAVRLAQIQEWIENPVKSWRWF